MRLVYLEVVTVRVLRLGGVTGCRGGIRLGEGLVRFLFVVGDLGLFFRVKGGGGLVIGGIWVFFRFFWCLVIVFSSCFFVF